MLPLYKLLQSNTPLIKQTIGVGELEFSEHPMLELQKRHSVEMGHLYSPVVKEKERKGYCSQETEQDTSYSFGGGVGNKFLLNCIKQNDKWTVNGNKREGLETSEETPMGP